MTYESFFANHRKRLEALYASSGATRWSVKLEEFARAAWQGIASAAEAEPREIPRLLEALRATDLALALGCVRSDERAWDTFCAEYRPALYDAARAFTREESQARELADSLLAELYGLDSSAPERRSRFAHFHGRSGLKTWLRAVLFQKFVDEYRRQAHLAPLADDPPEVAVANSSVSELDDRRYAECLSEAVEAVLGELPADEKLLLGYYYVQELTLKQIGRLAGEHEATVSRRLDGLREKLRKRIEIHLRRVQKLGAYDVDRCLDFASRGVTVELEKILKPQ